MQLAFMECLIRTHVSSLLSWCCAVCIFTRVGGALLKGEWEAAVKLILSGAPDEKQDSREGRQLYLEKGDIHVRGEPCACSGVYWCVEV